MEHGNHPADGHAKMKVTFLHYLNIVRVTMELLTNHMQEVLRVSTD